MIIDHKIDIEKIKSFDSGQVNIARILTDYIVTSFKKIESTEISFDQTNIAEADELLNRFALTDYYVAKNFLESIWLNYSEVYDNPYSEYDADRDSMYFQEIMLLLFSISFDNADKISKLKDLLNLIDQHYMKTKIAKDIQLVRELVSLLIENNISVTDFIINTLSIDNKDTNYYQLNDSALLLSILFYESKLYINYKYYLNPIDQIIKEEMNNFGIDYKFELINKYNASKIYSKYINKKVELNYVEQQKILGLFQSIKVKDNIFLSKIESKIYNFISYLNSTSDKHIQNRKSIFIKKVKNKKLRDYIPYRNFTSGILAIETYHNSCEDLAGLMFFTGKAEGSGQCVQIDYIKAYDYFHVAYKKELFGPYINYYFSMISDEHRSIEVYMKYYDYLNNKLLKRNSLQLLVEMLDILSNIVINYYNFKIIFPSDRLIEEVIKYSTIIKNNYDCNDQHKILIDNMVNDTKYLSHIIDIAQAKAIDYTHLLSLLCSKIHDKQISDSYALYIYNSSEYARNNAQIRKLLISMDERRALRTSHIPKF